MTGSPSTSSPPCARRSAISASEIACVPPTGTGQPAVCATVPSISPAPLFTGDGIRRNGMRANAGEQRASIVAAQQTPRRAALRAAPAGRCAPWSRDPVAANACRRGRSPARRRRVRSAARSSRRHDAPSSSSAQVRSSDAVRHRGGPARQRVGVRHLRRRQAALRARPDRTRRRTVRPAPSGCTAEQMSWQHAGELRVGRAAGAAARVGWASTTRTDRPARAQMTAAARPLGPLPTTVTSTSANRPPTTRAIRQPIRLAGVSLPVVLIADKLAESTVAALGDQVEVRWVDGPDREKLLAAVPEADALLVRSATTVDAEVLAAAPKLKIVARAGVGLDNVDVDAATARGVLVVNAPTSNIHSAAEHALALMLSAARQIPAADAIAARAHLEALVVLRHRDLRQDRRRRGPRPHRSAGRAAAGRVRHARRRLRPVRVVGARRAARHRAADPRRAAVPGRLHLRAPAEDAGDRRPASARRRWPRPSPGSSSSTPRAVVSIDEEALADAVVQRACPRRRSRRVRHRAVHRQPAVRAAAGRRHPAPRRVDRRGAGPRGHRRRREREAGAGR